MQRDYLKCACKRTKHVTHSIFNSRHAIIELFSIHKLYGNQNLFSPVPRRDSMQWSNAQINKPNLQIFFKSLGKC